MRLQALLIGMSVFVQQAFGDGAETMQDPIHVSAGGKPIDVERTGHAAPFVGDFDGDGLKDLLVGQFDEGRLRIYLNQGSNSQPQFNDFFWFKAGGKLATVPITCCTSFTPQLVDFDDDGKTDILTGSYPGDLYLFRRKSGQTFETGEVIKGRDNKALHAGPAAVPFAVDWDGDGDLDLIVGNVKGEVLFGENKPAKGRHEFIKPARMTAGGTPIKLESCAAPVAADWDHDGKLDLLVGAGDGRVVWYRNIGEMRSPRLTKQGAVVAKSPLGWKDDRARFAGQWGVRSKICVTDWNEDGRLDLLLGDRCGGFFGKPSQTAQEVAEERKARGALVAARERWSTTFQQYRKLLGETAPPEGRAREQALEACRGRLVEYKEQISAAETVLKRYEPQRQGHGFVWLFLRAPSREHK